MNNLTLVTSKMFGNVECNFWENESKEMFMTRNQIGEALDYATCGDAIEKIHKRYKERLDKFSTTTKLGGVESGVYKEREITVYSIKGLYEVCRYSRQDKANEFMDWVWDLLEGIRK